MESLKFFISLDHMKTLTPLLWTFHLSEALLFCPRIHSNIWDFTLTESYYFIITLIFTQTKPYRLSSAWKCSAIRQEDSICFKKDDCTGAVHYLSHYMNFNYGTITKYHLTILSKVSEKYKEEWSYMSGSQEVDLVSFHSFSFFLFPFLFYFPFAPFLAWRARIRGGRSHITQREF